MGETSSKHDCLNMKQSWKQMTQKRFFHFIKELQCVIFCQKNLIQNLTCLWTTLNTRKMSTPELLRNELLEVRKLTRNFDFYDDIYIKCNQSPDAKNYQNLKNQRTAQQAIFQETYWFVFSLDALSFEKKVWLFHNSNVKPLNSSSLRIKTFAFQNWIF